MTSDRPLTRREIECLRLSALYDPKDAAHRLGIAHRTLTVHRQNAYRKLGVHSQSAAHRALGWLNVPED